MKFTEMEIINMDHALTKIIFSGLTQYKQALLESDFGGYPANMFELVGVEGYNPTKGEDEDCWNQWLEILDKMIYAFGPKEEPNIDEYGFEFKTESIPAQEGFSQLIIDVTNREEYDRYDQDMKEWKEKCREGRMLFAEYFDSLWL